MRLSTRKRPQAVTAIAVGTLAIALSACGASKPAAGTEASDHSPSPAQSAATAPQQQLALSDSSNSLVLPLTPYYPSTQELAQQTNLQNVLLSRCGQQAGFNYPVVIADPENFGGDPGYGQFYDFGVTSLHFAETNGYHDTETVMRHHTASGAPPPRLWNLPQAEQTALGNCLTQIQRKDAAGHAAWSALVQNLGLQAWTEALSDRRVVAAFGRWSACMAASGFHYATPLKALAGEPGDSSTSTQWHTAQPSQLELTTAATDVRCKQKTGLLAVWIGTLASYQNQLVQKNLPRLQSDLAAFDKILGSERQAVGNGAG